MDVNEKLYQIGEFNISTTYEVGDRFTYNGELYEVGGTTVKEGIFPEAEIGCRKIPTFAVEPNANKTKRFTNKYPDNTPVYYKYYLNGYHFEQGDFIEKLGQIEDIEEELGISIKIFIKALLNGIYVKVNGEIIDFTNSVGWLWKFDKNDSWYEERPNEYYFAIIYHHVNEFYMKDYGKTWALTKEELIQ